MTGRSDAEAEAAAFLARIDDADEPLGPADVYDEPTRRAETYMLGGNGPTIYLTLILDTDGEVQFGVMEVIGWPEASRHVVDPVDATRLRDALRRS